jgi:hypothetical protein
MKLFDKKDRKKLNEGRSTGMGFAFAHKAGTDYHTVQPISPCKDFLNEILYAEKTGTLLSQVYGLKYDKVHNILGRQYSHLIIAICKHKSSTSTYNKEKWGDESLAFGKNYKRLESFMNQLEATIGIKQRTKIIRKADKYLVKMPNYWIETIYLLSLYSLLLRAYQTYDGSLEASAYIKKAYPYYEDNGLIMSIKSKIFLVLDNKRPDIKFKDYNLESPAQSIHNNAGIVGTSFIEQFK